MHGYLFIVYAGTQAISFDLSHTITPSRWQTSVSVTLDKTKNAPLCVDIIFFFRWRNVLQVNTPGKKKARRETMTQGKQDTIHPRMKVYSSNKEHVGHIAAVYKDSFLIHKRNSSTIALTVSKIPSTMLM